MNKLWLVAAREYHENLRTKTFWIGILSFPAILVLATVLPRIFDSAKDVRRYAILDRSEWLLPAIDERASYDDVQRLLFFVQEQARRGPEAVERMPDAMKPLAELVRDADDQRVESLARTMATAGASLLGGEAEGEALPDSVRASVGAQQGQFLDWMASLTPEEARELSAGIRSEDYERVPIPADVDDPEAWLLSKLDAGPESLFAYFVIGPDPLEGSAGFKYVSNNLTDSNLREWIERLANEEVRARRFARERVDPTVARRIQERVVFSGKQVSETGEEEEVSAQDIVRQWAPVGFVYLLWVSIFTIAQLLLTNTIEEKSNRIIEVLLSSITPLQLMSGKILGIAATGLTTILSWILCFLVFLKLLPTFLDLPAEIDLSILIRDPTFLVSFVVYFLLGFLLYASLLVGLGSACNSIKEAQNLMSPIMMALMLPLMAMIPVSQDPNGTLAVVLSWIPPFTPFVMMNRAAGPPETWEYVGTGVLLIVSVALAFWAAAKIFRVGVLMTGKPPRIREILRWIWMQEGQAAAVPEKLE